MGSSFYIKQPKSTALKEVAIIRPFVIFLLVVLHAFAIFGDGWDKPACVDSIGIYYWLTVLISGFRIETIALVAGYVYSYQTNTLNRSFDFKPYCIKKFKRLIIPCFVFSIIYYFLFDYNYVTPPSVFSVVSSFFGCGHLWFLPMLFWCFLILWYIDRHIKKSYLLLIFFGAISIIPLPFDLLGLKGVVHFIFYCYWGYILYLDKNKIIKHLQHNSAILCLWGGYCVLTLIFYKFVYPNLDYSLGNFGIMLKTRIIANSFKLIISIIGVIALYISALFYLDRKQYEQLPTNIAKMSTLCYGIYVYHQFILKFIYYYSSIPSCVNSYVLPWLVLMVTLVLSYVFTCLSLNTKIGRFLIG